METNATNSWKKVISDKFPFLAGTTALGYLIAYFFQVGIALYYGYPEDFIFFDLSTLLKSIAILYTALILFVAPISLLGVFKFKKILYLVAPVLSIALYYVSFGLQNPLVFFNNTTSISYMIIISTFSLPIFYANLIINSLEGSLQSMSRLFLMAVTALSLVTVPFFIGQVTSFKVNTYYQLKNKEDFILLSSSGGKMVFGKCINGEKEFFLSDTSPNLSLQPITSKEIRNKIRDCYFFSKKN